MALSNLGICYQYGRGVPQSKTIALMYFKKAVENGHKKAQEYYDNLRAQ